MTLKNRKRIRLENLRAPLCSAWNALFKTPQLSGKSPRLHLLNPYHNLFTICPITSVPKEISSWNLVSLHYMNHLLCEKNFKTLAQLQPSILTPAKILRAKKIANFLVSDLKVGIIFFVQFGEESMHKKFQLDISIGSRVIGIWKSRLGQVTKPLTKSSNFQRFSESIFTLNLQENQKNHIKQYDRALNADSETVRKFQNIPLHSEIKFFYWFCLSRGLKIEGTMHLQKFSGCR